jgi:hypothetical protein
VACGRAPARRRGRRPRLSRPLVGRRRHLAAARDRPAGECRQGLEGRCHHRGSWGRRQAPRPRGTTPAPAATPPASSGGSGGDGSTPPLGPSGSGGSGGSDKPAPKPAGDPLDVYHLSLRFGRAESAHLTTYHDVARLSPLPTADNPFFVYTGVLKDGKTAVFLLSSDATATGDGHCSPSPKSCQTIEVKQGDTEFFDLTVNDEPVQYQLDVVRVFKKGASSAVAAAASHERHSNAGADMLQQAHAIGSSSFKGAASYRWLPDSGVLIRAPHRGKVRASVNGAVAASPADAAGALPGLPVWHWAVAGA